MVYLVFHTKQGWDLQLLESGQYAKLAVLKSYVYVAVSKRVNGKVRQQRKYLVPIEQWTMKEIVYLLTGKALFTVEHQERFWKESGDYCRALDSLFTRWQRPPREGFGWTRDYIVRRYVESVPCMSCVYDWIEDNGMPKRFESIFREHGILEAVVTNAMKWETLRSDTNAVSLHVEGVA